MMVMMKNEFTIIDKIQAEHDGWTWSHDIIPLEADAPGATPARRRRPRFPLSDNWANM